MREFSRLHQNGNSSAEVGQPSSRQRHVRKVMAFQRRVRTEHDRKHFLPKVARRIAVEHSSPQSLVDIGSGKGYFGEAFQEVMPNSLVVSVDMGKEHAVDTPYAIASADALPFRNNRFDVSTLFYVLHHTDDPKVVLEEAKRVSNTIVVQEDTYRNKWQRKLIEAHVRGYKRDASFNGASINSDEGWQEVFKEAGLQVTRRRRIRKIGYPVPRYEYHLAPIQNAEPEVVYTLDQKK